MPDDFAFDLFKQHFYNIHPKITCNVVIIFFRLNKLDFSIEILQRDIELAMEKHNYPSYSVMASNNKC